MHETIETALLRLLKTEKAAILAGDFDGVLAQTEQKTILLARLERAALSQHDLTDLLVDLTENQTLLASALQGIKNAQARLKELEKVRNGLTVYDQEGRSGEIRNARPALERKA